MIQVRALFIEEIEKNKHVHKLSAKKGKKLFLK